MHAFAKWAKICPAILTPVFLTLSFPGYDQGWLIWLALVPLLAVSARLRPAVAFGVGLAAGMAGLFGIFWWAFNIPGFRYFHGIIAAFYLGLYPAVWCAAVSLAHRANLSPIMVAPSVWVSLDFLKSNAGFLSFPFATLAHSQHGYPAILQISAITGEYGVTFLIVLVNAVIASLVTRSGAYRQQVFAGAAVLAVLIFGIFQLYTDQPSRSVRITAVQPLIEPGEQDNDPRQAHTLRKLEDLTVRAAATRPDLIVWPETAVLNLPASPDTMGKLKDLAERHRASILLGTSERVKFVNQPLGPLSRQGVRSYNAAYLVRPVAGPPQAPYRKNILVPFGEYVPLSEVIQWPSWFFTEGFQTMPGNEITIFTLMNGEKLGVLICWENLFPKLARDEVKAGARILVNLVNDAWFGKTAASRQHNTASVLRAVENAVPVVVASNWGPSQIIDPRGRTVKVSGAFSREAITGDVPVQGKLTLYTRYGDLFAWACIGAAFLFFICIALNSISLKYNGRFTAMN